MVRLAKLQFWMIGVGLGQRGAINQPVNRLFGVQGGDLLVFPEVDGAPARTWLVADVVETWPDWCHVLATLQVDGT